MDLIKFYPLSLADGVEDLAADEEATGFEKENLQDYNKNTSWKGTTTGTQYIEIDFGASHNVSYFLLYHNLSSGSFVRLFGDDASDFSTEVALTGQVQIVAGNSPILIETFSIQTYRYYRLQMSGASAAPEINLFYIGTPYNMSLQPSYSGMLGQGGGEKKYSPIISQSASGKRFGNQVQEPRNQWTYLWELIGSADYGNLTGLIDDVGGSLRPFFFTDIDEETYFIRLMNDMIGGSPRSFNIFDTQLIEFGEEF